MVERRRNTIRPAFEDPDEVPVFDPDVGNKPDIIPKKSIRRRVVEQLVPEEGAGATIGNSLGAVPGAGPVFRGGSVAGRFGGQAAQAMRGNTRLAPQHIGKFRNRLGQVQRTRLGKAGNQVIRDGLRPQGMVSAGLAAGGVVAGREAERLFGPESEVARGGGTAGKQDDKPVGEESSAFRASIRKGLESTSAVRDYAQRDADFGGGFASARGQFGEPVFDNESIRRMDRFTEATGQSRDSASFPGGGTINSAPAFKNDQSFTDSIRQRLLIGEITEGEAAQEIAAKQTEQQNDQALKQLGIDAQKARTEAFKAATEATRSGVEFDRQEFEQRTNNVLSSVVANSGMERIPPEQREALAEQISGEYGTYVGRSEELIESQYGVPRGTQAFDQARQLFDDSFATLKSIEIASKRSAAAADDIGLFGQAFTPSSNFFRSGTIRERENNAVYADNPEQARSIIEQLASGIAGLKNQGGLTFLDSEREAVDPVSGNTAQTLRRNMIPGNTRFDALTGDREEIRVEVGGQTQLIDVSVISPRLRQQIINLSRQFNGLNRG